MNQDQKKYFRQRIDAAVQSKILELNLQVQKLENPVIEDYLTKKNFKPKFEMLFTHCDMGNFYISKVGGHNEYGFEVPYYVLFDMDEYDKKVKSVEDHNRTVDKVLQTAINLVRSDADKVIDYVMFADEKEALKQLEEFQKKAYKVQ